MWALQIPTPPPPSLPCPLSSRFYFFVPFFSHFPPIARFSFSATAAPRRLDVVRLKDTRSDDGLKDTRSDDEDLSDDEEMMMGSKPRGFGVGKKYDTALEDELLQEIERSRKAQEANLQKLKKTGGKVLAKKTAPLPVVPPKELEVPTFGARVRLSNLPKKKNIHRDLQLAFKGFPGLINISPAVAGSKKTHDPICKGFAFVDFKTEEAARRFVGVYSEKKLLFGKIDKRISFRIIYPEGVLNSSKRLSHEKTIPLPESVDNNEFPLNDLSGAEHMESPLLFSVRVPSLDCSRNESGSRHTNTSLSIDLDIGEEAEQDIVNSNDVKTSSHKEKKKVLKKKNVRRILLRSSTAPTSISRLKGNERSALAAVFSKYGGDAATTASSKG